MKAINGKPFLRGIRLRGNKARSEDEPICPLPPPARVAIPLFGHAGAPAQAIVRVGQSVHRGELIALAKGTISANVHASVAGTVSAIETRTDGTGVTGEYIVIERTEGDDAFLPPLSHPSPEEIALRVREAGIVGMGGAGFPTAVKLTPPAPVDTLILNGAECEPYLTCDDRLMRERTQDIVRGGEYLAKALGASNLLIAIEKNKPQAIAQFEGTPLRVVKLKKRYPMGSEKHLIYCCTGRKVPAGKLPADAGVVVQNVATALAVKEAVELGKPLIERVVTLSGGGMDAPCNLLCPIGTPLSTLLERAGGQTERAVKLLLGGPMTGKALTGSDAVVTKTTSGVLLLTARETDVSSPTPCINCGKCAEVCPMRLMPMQIEFYTAAKEYSHAERYGGVTNCIECGACSYICPARRPLAQAIKTAKSELRRAKQ